jgi:hypothetical protein
MKKLLLFGALALTINSFSQVPTYVPTNGLVGWWGFNGNANDESVNGNDGVNNGATLTTDRFTNPNSAYSFDGVNDKIEMDYVFDFPERTISGWFNLSQFSATIQAIIVNDYPALNNGLIIFTVGSDDSLALQNGTAHCSAIIPTLNTWYFVASTRDATATKYYINGVELCQVVNDALASASATGQMLRVGADRYGNQYWFNGLIDDVGLWNRALTECEIQDLYNAQLTSVANTVTQTGALLEADETGATYQWLDCDNNNSIINGETNQSYTPAVTGNYAVEVNMNGCVDTSACMLVDFTGVNEINNSAIKVYPNPTKESFNIEVDASIVGSNYIIFDQLGKIVQNGILSNASQILNVEELSKGIYNLKIDNSDIHVKLIKE